MPLFRQYSASSWHWFNPIWCKYDHIHLICALRQQYETKSLLLICYNKDARTNYVHVLICRFYMQEKRKKKKTVLFNLQKEKFLVCLLYVLNNRKPKSKRNFQTNCTPKACKCSVHLLSITFTMCSFNLQNSYENISHFAHCIFTHNLIWLKQI